MGPCQTGNADLTCPHTRDSFWLCDPVPVKIPIQERIIIIEEIRLTTNDALLQVYNREGSAMLANFPASEQPYAVFDDKVVNQLFALCRTARMEAAKSGGADAVLELCSTLEGVLKPYRKIRDEYYDRLEIEREREDAEGRLQDVQNDIQKSRLPD